MKMLEAIGLGRDGCLFNIGKYLYRMGKKGRPEQDISKALWYARRLVERGAYGKKLNKFEFETIKKCSTIGLSSVDENGGNWAYLQAEGLVNNVLNELKKVENGTTHG